MSDSSIKAGVLIGSSLLVGLLLSILPMPSPLDMARPMWLGMILAYWCLNIPHRIGMGIAWVLGFGLASDVLTGALLGQNVLVLGLQVFMVLSLQQRMRMFPVLQQSLVLLVVFGLAQLVQLWLDTLSGNRAPTLLFLIPVPVSALLWPWLSMLLHILRKRLRVH